MEFSLKRLLQTYIWAYEQNFMQNINLCFFKKYLLVDQDGVKPIM